MYVAYQECLLRGEVKSINIPGDDLDGGGNNEGNANDYYFAEDLWAV